MKSLAVVSFFAAAALCGLPVGAQTVAPPVPLGAMPAGVAPPLYRPPYQQTPAPPPEGVLPGQNPEDFANNQVDEAQTQAPLPLPGSDQAGLGVPAPPAQYDPNNPADPANQNLVYPPADLGPDNEIAQSYDDGYDPQAYTQFQTALAPYGSWSDDPTYGNVWSPYASTVGSDFVPYASCGHWLMSEYGWTWISDLSWGWAPFHYGRWIPITGRGWSWVPGTMWGPAWVSWRSGNGYVGWSPLPPRGARLNAGVGGRSAWRFTTAAGLGAAHPSFVNPHDLPSMFARTTVVANDRLLTRGQWTVHVNAGPTRGILARPVRLSSAAPHALPHLAVYPHPGVSLNARPWMQTGGAGAYRGAYGQPNRGAGPVATEAHGQSWNAGASPRTVGRTPAYGPAAARPAMRAPATAWSRQPYYGNSAGYGRTNYATGGSYNAAPR
ncbi:MAG TPA: DUF6600 domain-containing protein, partial [Polyangia bacterium]|nr:DUF6600 domain-containing protein [Polyangia bacterium]